MTWRFPNVGHPPNHPFLIGLSINHPAIEVPPIYGPPAGSTGEKRNTAAAAATSGTSDVSSAAATQQPESPREEVVSRPLGSSGPKRGEPVNRQPITKTRLNRTVCQLDIHHVKEVQSR